MKKQKEIMAFWVVISIVLAAFFIPAVSADGSGAVYTEASVNPATINLGESTTVTLRAFTNVTTEKRDVDVVLVTDLSGSMNGAYKLGAAKNALKTFVGLAGDEMYIGLASFSNANQRYSDATMAIYNNGNNQFNPYGDFYDSSRTNPAYYHSWSYAYNGYSDAHRDVSFTQSKADLNSTINSYAAKGGTNIAGGINAAKKMLDESGDPDHLQVIVVMSDGIATMAPIAPGSLDAYMPSDWESSDRSETGRIAAERAADVVKGQGITVYAIGFGSKADADTLVDVASSGDKYYYAPSNDQLAEIYSEISEEIEALTGARAYHVLPDGMVYAGNASIAPNIIGDNTTLEWIIGELAPEVPWDVTFEFEVQPQNPGNQPVNAPGSEVTYTYGSEPGSVPFPEVFVDVKTPPVLDSIGDRTVDEDTLLTFVINATDPDGDSLTNSGSNLPAGASFDTDTRTFSWTPGYDQAGTYQDVHFEVTDGSLSDSENITITVNNVNRAPELTVNPASVTVNETKTVTISVSATDEDDGDNVTITAENKPEGATFDGTTFRWVTDYDDAETYIVKFKAEDENGGIDEKNAAITVNNVNRAPKADFCITPGAPHYAGQEITFDASASYDPDGDSIDYDWDFGDGHTTVTNETIVTHAFAKGNYTVTLTVTDDEGETASMNKSVQVKGNIYIPESGEGPYIGESIPIHVEFQKSAENKYLNVTVDGCEIGNIDNTNSTTFTWIPMSSGVHTIRAYLYNKSTGEVYDEGWMEKTIYLKKVE